MQQYIQAAAYIEALTGLPADEAQIWFRCIHDSNKGVPAHKYYGTLAQHWETLCRYNSDGWGIFVNINAFAANVEKHELKDVWYIQTQAVDLDNTLTAQQNYEIATRFNPPPTFAVQSSQGKFHLYWTVAPYQGNERYDDLQRRLRQLFDGDRAIVDPTRVLRLPGFYNHKYSTPGGDKYIAGALPHMVECWSLGGYGYRIGVEQLEAATAHVNVIDGGTGGRHELGDPKLAAPSLEWLTYAMSHIDPNTLDRGEWISVSAAFKQSGWSLADENTLFNIWSEWCAQYNGDDTAENLKNWNSIRNSETGWKSFRRRVPVLKAYEDFGYKKPPAIQPQPAQQQQASAGAIPMPETPEFGDILTDIECKSYFQNCFFVENVGKIMTPRGRFMNSTQFNGAYGGKLFVITPDGKTTDEPWKAATRSTMWTVPKVDHVRFVPTEKTFSIIEDQLGRLGVNTYIPIRLKYRKGDVSPFLRHMELMLPDETDRHLIYAFLAHNVKYPGVKVPWAPMIQSAEGVGKGFIKKVIEGMLGEMYTYSPPATELIGSSATFNSWQRNKLMIVVDEIKIDERRELIEIMKPWIGDDRIQIQSKGENQEMEDNPANYCFFSNYKDAIPLVSSGRRYSIFYSVIQSVDDLLVRGMDDNYFNALFQWRENGGQEYIVDWLLNYPVEKRWLMRAPKTSSYTEALKVSRGPLEICIANAIEDALTGFRGGYVSTLAVIARAKQIGLRAPSHAAVRSVLETLGYYELGRAVRAYSQESAFERTTVYGCLAGLPVASYGRAQGYAE